MNTFLCTFSLSPKSEVSNDGIRIVFMVSKKVEIITKSYKEGAQAVKWTCDGSPEFTLEEVEKADRGTDIVLYIDDDCNISSGGQRCVTPRETPCNHQ